MKKYYTISLCTIVSHITIYEDYRIDVLVCKRDQNWQWHYVQTVTNFGDNCKYTYKFIKGCIGMMNVQLLNYVRRIILLYVMYTFHNCVIYCTPQIHIDSPAHHCEIHTFIHVCSSHGVKILYSILLYINLAENSVLEYALLIVSERESFSPYVYIY